MITSTKDTIPDKLGSQPDLQDLSDMAALIRKSHDALHTEIDEASSTVLPAKGGGWDGEPAAEDYEGVQDATLNQLNSFINLLDKLAAVPSDWADSLDSFYWELAGAIAGVLFAVGLLSVALVDWWAAPAAIAEVVAAVASLAAALALTVALVATTGISALKAVRDASLMVSEWPNHRSFGEEP